MAKPKVGARRTDDNYTYVYGMGYDLNSGSWVASNLDGWGVRLRPSTKSLTVAPPFQTNFGGYPVVCIDGLFCNYKELTLDVSILDVSGVESAKFVFANNKAEQILGLFTWDTSQMITMQGMFSDCINLTNLDVSYFSTSSVTDMSKMFQRCCNCKQLDLRNFDTSKVVDMKCMFDGDYNLGSLNLSSFDTSRVRDMRGMFAGCGIKSLSISSFNTSATTDMSCMFYRCQELQSLDLSSFDTSSVTAAKNMFYGCEFLESLDVSSFDTSNVTNMWNMFYGCKRLKSLNLSNFDTSNVIDMSYMFYNCRNLTSLDVSNFNTSNVVNMYGMFSTCTELTSLDVSGFVVSPQHFPKMNGMFQGCTSLATLNISSLNLEDAEECISAMFKGCVFDALYVWSKTVANQMLKDGIITQNKNDTGEAAFVANIVVPPEEGTVYREDNVEYRFGLVWDGLMWKTPKERIIKWGIKINPDTDLTQVKKSVEGYPVAIA